MSKTKSKDKSDNVIDWEEALEQCGGEDDFLHELLSDLHDEATNHINTIREAVDGLDVEQEDFDKADAIRRAAHSIKGAAANLMCHGLKDAAQFCEKFGTQGARGELDWAEFCERITETYETLETEMTLFGDELTSRGILN